MSEETNRHSYPMGKAYPDSLTPVAEFKIGERTLSLYTVKGYMPSENFTLYWNDETNPVQHNMTPYEVFKALESLLETEADKHKEQTEFEAKARDREIGYGLDHATVNFGGD